MQHVSPPESSVALLTVGTQFKATDVWKAEYSILGVTAC